MSNPAISRDPFLGTPYRVVRRLYARNLTDIYELEAPVGRCLAKVLRPEFLSMRQVVDRMRLESEVLGVLTHVNVVRRYDAGTTRDGCPYIVLERLAGHTLRREVVKRGPLPVPEAVDYMVQALAGAAAIHRAGVVHRDLKLDNLFLAREAGMRRIKILDFGFAKAMSGPAMARVEPLVISTDQREFVGAHRFAAPEQIVAGKTVDQRADIYTLGLVLYNLTFGREPFHDVRSRDELLRAQQERPLYPPSPKTGERVPEALTAIITRATSKDREERFSSAEEFAAELRAFLNARGMRTRRSLTVTQHAEMTAEIQADPERAADIRLRYGIVTAAHIRAVEHWWKSNVAIDPATHEKWQALVDRFLRPKGRRAR